MIRKLYYFKCRYVCGFNQFKGNLRFSVYGSFLVNMRFVNRDTDAMLLVELLAKLNSAAEVEFCKQRRQLLIIFHKGFETAARQIQIARPMLMEKPLFTLLSAGRPSETLRIRLTFTTECVSEMSYYAAERLPLNVFTFKYSFRPSRDTLFSFLLPFPFSFPLETSPESFCSLELSSLNCLHCQVSHLCVLFIVRFSCLFYIHFLL